MKPIRAWYFSDESRKLRYGDGRDIAIGIEHTVKGRPEIRGHGLHGSELILDALGYAPGTIVWIVELSGWIKRGHNNISATRRKYIAGGIDVSDILSRFARSEALLVADKWDCPKIVREWLETGDESIRLVAWLAARAAIESAAGSIAESAARLAAQSSAESSADSSAESSAQSSAELSARSAAWSSAWSAALSAEKSSSDPSSTQSASWLATQSVAWIAARSLIWLAANERLEAMIIEALK